MSRRERFGISSPEGIRMYTKKNEIEFNIDKIVKYLEKYKESLPKLYNWNANIEKLVDLKILTSNEVNELNTKSPYEKELVLKKTIQKKLNESYQKDSKMFNDLCLWIIKDWGGITGAKDSSTLELIEVFLSQEEPAFNRIASSSKVGSYMFPEKYVIYDSRVAYSLNWIILAENAGEKYFPIPEGRNSKMSAFEMGVLIRLKNIELYKPNSISELHKRLYINAKDKTNYIPTKKAYTELNKLIKKISSRLWKGEKSEMLYYTEMLLFSIADREIFNDITNRITIDIK